ncbi:FAD-binding oxidoreductase [Mycolicibacterium sphagni]|uniref:FAD-binding oxidoreductase n=1 Tax=Mycolicibacterium sphagni TaxID=1786 RepID=UPI0021F3A786|nr:FAD-binding oxidoreductase [Mycolicibacterium sphagni]MCV7177067.1 FAD-binding oxidoreductase [Mycolicibacterium sphagni]
MGGLPVGRHFFRGDPGYEAARCAAVWNGRTPHRYPDVVVQAVDADEVASAVRFARAEGHHIGVRSGGHSWAGNHLRDGGMLLDVSRLARCTIDVDTHTAIVGPGIRGDVLAAQLVERGLFFPTGHVIGVGLGGYLLQGGYGWNGRALGPACESILGLDVVTADGERLFIDSDHDSELYWAARGAGPGFFAVVTGFHLRVYPHPKASGSSLYVYPAAYADDVFTWARAIGAEVDRSVEFQLVTTRSVPAVGLEDGGIVVVTPVFADTDDDAAGALAIFETCPVRAKAVAAMPYTPASLADLYEAAAANYPTGHRYATDNMWTSASSAELLPGIHQILATMPPNPAHFLWMNWGPAPARQDMSFSVEDDIYLALYTVWADAADDERYGDWARSNMAAMAPLATGIQLGDENLGARPARFATDTALARLDLVRAHYDPDGLFHSWMGRLPQ